ncbi:MAG: hypothetical protein H7A32_01160 [Deltaproteobacteria bacterium]|nr:hypothetical protein [Deltaproteobacteria bacterium]
MGDSIYSNRYHRPQNQNNPQRIQNQQNIPEQAYIEAGELSGQSSKPDLSQTQQALSDRYQQTRSNIGDTLEEFENRMRSVRSSNKSVDSKLVALDEIELLLGELESQQTLYNALENNMSREGLDVDQQNLEKVIDRYQKNIDGYQASLEERKAAEDAARAQEEALLAEQAAQEAAELAHAQEIENRKVATSEALNSYVGYLNGSLSPRYGSKDSINKTQAESIFYAMANAVKSGDWSHVKNQVSDIEEKYRGNTVALVVAILKYQAPQSVIEMIPPEVFYTMSSAIQGAKNEKDTKVSGAPESHTNSGYAAIAMQLAGISENYLNSPPEPVNQTATSVNNASTHVMIHNQ